METKIKIFFGRERFIGTGSDANQLFIFIWPYSVIFKTFEKSFKGEIRSVYIHVTPTYSAALTDAKAL